MQNKKIAKRYLNKYFKSSYLEENDIELKSLVRILNKVEKNCNKANVSGSLPLAEKLLKSIISADPNVISNYHKSDIVIRGLYSQCKELVKSLGGNDHNGEQKEEIRI